MNEDNTRFVYPNPAPAGTPPQQTAQPPAREKPLFWKYGIIVLVTALVTFILTAGSGILVFLSMNQGNAASEQNPLGITFATDPDTQAALSKFWAVYEALDKNYYKDLSDAEMLDAMARGLVNEMDSPYTMYLTAEQNQQIIEDMSGNYSGIGAFVALNKEGLVEITEVIENSPAEEAGVMVGDIFTEVDGQDVTGFGDINSVAALVRGEEGTWVDLVFYRPSEQKNISVSVERRKITTASVSYRMLTDSVGYVMIRDFSSNVSGNFFNAMQNLQAQGARNIVFDLRNNTGGLANEVISMLDYLLPEETIATLKGRDNGRDYSESWTSQKSMGVPADMRYAILINGFTASASELFSGCLHDLGKAWLVGEQSFGKGSGTISINLDDGSAINLTTFLYYLPNGESIEGEGLEPDQVVALPEEYQDLSISQLTPEQDTQLQAALNHLEYELGP